jgi:hypothetical protein
VVLAAVGAFGVLWVTLASLRETPRPAAQNVAAERAAAEQAAGAALYQEFLRWRQLKGR